MVLIGGYSLQMPARGTSCYHEEECMVLGVLTTGFSATITEMASQSSH